MKWTQEPEKPRRPGPVVLRHGDITVVIDAKEENTWLHFSLSLCVRGESTVEKCKETWPRESIAVARRELDKLEETLNKEQDNADQRSD
jgi:hypothetical protein